MRVLFVTNVYSPCGSGWGYMQLCEEVADGLSIRGHTVTVLTSTRRDGAEIVRPYPVHRLLSLDPDWHSPKSAAWQFFVGRRRRERQAVASLHQLVAEFRPDVIFVWHAIGLPRVLLHEAEQVPNVPVVYYLAGYLPELPDEYIAYWKAQPVHWLAKLVKRPLSKLALDMLAREGKPIPLKYERVICVSDYVRRRLASQGLISSEAVVIHNGVDVSQFGSNGQVARTARTTLRCLVAGQVAPEKGVHTAVDALAQLQTQAEFAGRVTLTILGHGPADYGQYLRARVNDYGLQDVVEFRSPVPREQMPTILAQHNVLILPSEYDEPLARSMQEGMSCGLLVVGTVTGGSGELLVHEKTGLVFEPGKPHLLAAQLVSALREPSRSEQLAEAGRQAVVERFNIHKTIEHIEQYLLGLKG